MAHLASNRERRSQELAAPSVSAGRPRSTSGWQALSSRRVWVPLLVLALLILAWEWAINARLLAPVLFSPPSVITATIVRGVGDGTLARNLGATLASVFIGLLLGGGAGALMGLTMGWSRALRQSTDPWIAAVHAIPKVAVLPLLIFFLGIGDEPKIALAALTAFFPMLINTMAGVGQINPTHFQVARNYGASLPQLVRRVILPGSLPMMMSGLRIAFNTAFVVAIAAEMVNGSTGLGRVIWFAWETLQVEMLWSSLVVSALVGITFNLLLVGLTKWMVPWQVEQQV